jgi:nucleoside diphosphate kinase
MTKSVRPRIRELIYELLKRAASSRCVPFSQWLAEAITEKAAREGFEIVNSKIELIKDKTAKEHFKIIDGTIFYSETFVNEMKNDQTIFTKSSSEESSSEKV